MRGNAWLIALAFVVLGLQGLGCGDTEDTRTVSEAAFTNGGNKICVQAAEEQADTYRRIVKAAQGKQVTSADGRAAEDELIASVVSSIEGLVEEFKELGAPAGKEEAVSKMLDDYEQGAEVAQAEPQVFLSGEAFLDAEKKAEQLGLDKCASV